MQEAALGLLHLSPSVVQRQPPYHHQYQDRHYKETEQQKEQHQYQKTDHYYAQNPNLPKRKQTSNDRHNPSNTKLDNRTVSGVASGSSGKGSESVADAMANGVGAVVETVDADQTSIQCICGLAHDDGFSIGCDSCERWCHSACFDISGDNVPENWECWICRPRYVDRERAVKVQMAKLRDQQAVVAELERRMKGEMGGLMDGRESRKSPGVERRRPRAMDGSGDQHNKKRKRRMSSAVEPPLHLQHHPLTLNTKVPNGNAMDLDAADQHDEGWKQGYVHITNDVIPDSATRSKLMQAAQHWRGVSAIDSFPNLPELETPVVLDSKTKIPKTSVLPLPSSSTQSPYPSWSSVSPSGSTEEAVRPPTYTLHTLAPIPSSSLITPFPSLITPSSAYLSNPLNAYAHMGMPKTFVHLLGKPLDVCLDARAVGGEGRFVRSGCRPNAVLRPVICNGVDPQHTSSSRNGASSATQEGGSSSHTKGRSSTAKGDPDSEALSFGVFALRDLKANEEVVLGWEWDDGNAVHHLPAIIETPGMFS